MATYKEPGPGYTNDFYPYLVPFSSMITLNDKAMQYTMNFMFEFYKEALTNADLSAPKYYNACLTNVLFLLDVHERARSPFDGRGGFAKQYHINDGTTNANRISWGRRYEPPAFSPNAEGENTLMAWLLWETNQAVRARIEDTMLSWALYWKYNALPFNHPSIREYATNSTGWSQAFTNYVDGLILTYKWWAYYNHNTNSAEFVNVAAPGVPGAPVTFAPAITGLDAIVSGTQYGPWYAYWYGTNAIRTVTGSAVVWDCSKKINAILRDGEKPSVELWHYNGDAHDQSLTNLFFVDGDVTLFKLNAKGIQAMADVQGDTGLILPKHEVLYGQEYLTITDNAFCSRVAALAAYAQSLRDGVSDSDGDGISDEDEVLDKTDPLDSESRKPTKPKVTAVR
jgi:hypothetical protein